MQHGVDRSAETLAIEGELAVIQQKAAEWHQERRDLSAKILSWTSQETTSKDPLTQRDVLLTSQVLARKHQHQTNDDSYSDMNAMAQQQKAAIEAIKKRQEERSKSLPRTRTLGDGCPSNDQVEKKPTSSNSNQWLSQQGISKSAAQLGGFYKKMANKKVNHFRICSAPTFKKLFFRNLSWHRTIALE